jgi:RNA polymerase sigma-70 factor (ECF subfamily)
MNLAIDHCRKGKRRKTSAYDEAVAPRDDDGNILEAPQSENAQKLLHRKELQARIYEALDELSEEHREVVLLREIEGLSYKEISDQMDIPEGTVMSRLFYARKRLQLTLKDLL